jgi:hypothetical protein
MVASRYLITGHAKAPLTASEIHESLSQAAFIKLWPQSIREIQLGIGKLPHKKITDTPFATSTDEQIRIR